MPDAVCCAVWCLMLCVRFRMLEKESNIIRREAENNKIKLQIETEAETEALKSRVRGWCCAWLWLYNSLTIYLAPYLFRGYIH